MPKPSCLFIYRIFALVLLAAILPAACTETRFAPPSPALRTQLGATGAVAMPGSAALDVGKQPVSGSGAGALLGAGQGAAAGLPFAAAGCSTADAFSCALGLALGAAVAVVAAPIGAVAGAVNAHSEEEVRLADANLHAAFAESQVTATGRLRDRIVSEAGSLSAYKILAYSPAPGFPKAPVATRVDSRLEITVSAVGLTVAGRINPDATLFIVAQAQFDRGADGAVLYRRSWVYRGATRNYFTVAADNAQLLRADIDAGLGVLAAKIVNDLFESNTPEVKVGSPGAGTAVTLDAWTAPASAVATPQASGTGTAGTLASAGGNQPASSGPVDVPFTIDYGGGSVAGVARLENGRLTGQSTLAGRPITLSGTLKDRRLALDVYGAIISPGIAQTGSGIGYYCSGSVASDHAAGSVTLPFIASCGTENIRDTLHLELPAT